MTDTAEVIITLVALGQDPDSLLSSSGNTAVDYMLNEIFNAVGDFISPDGNLMDATWASVPITCWTISFISTPRPQP
ncbi:MAG: hypothetical protein RQM92_11480 [Candidatus Syntrophopropionicum ammoniitolerans]